jgi:hypothetical protein
VPFNQISVLDIKYVHETYSLHTCIHLGIHTSNGKVGVESVSIVSDYRLDDWVIEAGSPAEENRIFPLASVSRPALGPNQPPVQWVLGALSPGVKRGPGRDADHSPPLVTRSRVGMSYTSSPPCVSKGVLWDCLLYIGKD